MDIMKLIGRNLRSTLHIPSDSLAKILNDVRNIVLNWTLKMEKDGILGEGLTFSKNEAEIAHQGNHTINYLAVSGDVVSSQIQQGTNASSQNKGSK